jgi:hypothetical protein
VDKVFSDPLFASADPRLVRRFAGFHEDNPDVFKKFEKYASLMRLSGREKYSAWVIVQVIRWEHDLQTTGDVFKVNNDFIALYSRLLIVQQPVYRDFFELRGMKSVRRLSFEDAKRQGVKPKNYK